MPTIDQLLREQAGNRRTGLRFSARSWTHDEVLGEQARRAALLGSLRHPGPFHVALLLDNVPEFVFWLGGAALAGAVIVGGNPTHRGDELARDLSHTECQLLVTDKAHRSLVEGHDLGPALPPDRILVVDDVTGGTDPASEYGARLAEVVDAELPDPAETSITEDTLGYLLFTSGTSGAPKACLCSQGRVARIGETITQMFELTSDDVCYLSMPLFHSNALDGRVGARARRRCDRRAPRPVQRVAVPPRRETLRRHVLQLRRQAALLRARHPRTTGRRGQHPPARVRQRGRPGRRRPVRGTIRLPGAGRLRLDRGGCVGAADPRHTGERARSRAPGTLVIDPETGLECPRARFDERGRLLNAEEAIGEMVSTTGGTGFEGYWRNAEAEEARVRNGWYWTGDLAYRDEDDFFYFAGRDYDWLRVDGENFAAAPVEEVLQRHPDVLLASVYAVPDPVVGDQVMATLLLHPGAEFDPAGFASFLAGEEDLGTKWAPRFVRIAPELPETATTKVLKRVLRAERWRTSDPVWWRPDKGAPYRPLTPEDAEALDRAVAGR